jgi:hypothetical protein
MATGVSAVSPAILAYLAAAERHITATYARPRDRDEYRAAIRAREEAWAALTADETPRWWPSSPGPGVSFAAFITPVSPAENEHVWIPVLAAQMDCTPDEAAVAFALGMRPAGYPDKEW